MKGLVLGFTDFGTVTDNPSARLAAALDGQGGDGVELVGCPMPVSYARSLEHTAALVQQHAPDWILGIGVATSRDHAAFERFGTGRCGSTPDVDGCVGVCTDGVRPSGLPVDHLAARLGCAVSEDCGTYVCNGWLYGAIGRFAPVPVGFLHVPPAGVDVAALRDAVVAPWPEAAR